MSYCLLMTLDCQWQTYSDRRLRIYTIHKHNFARAEATMLSKIDTGKMGISINSIVEQRYWFPEIG